MPRDPSDRDETPSARRVFRCLRDLDKVAAARSLQDPEAGSRFVGMQWKCSAEFPCVCVSLIACQAVPPPESALPPPTSSGASVSRESESLGMHQRPHIDFPPCPDGAAAIAVAPCPGGALSEALHCPGRSC